MYVDDLLSGDHDKDILLKARSVIAILETAGFQLRKSAANAKWILDDLLNDYLLNQHFINLDEDSTAKTLGIRWNAIMDSFYFLVQEF